MKSVFKVIFDELKAMSRNNPNERLPKEEQLRSALYSHFKLENDTHYLIPIIDYIVTELDGVAVSLSEFIANVDNKSRTWNTTPVDFAKVLEFVSEYGVLDSDPTKLYANVISDPKTVKDKIEISYAN